MCAIYTERQIKSYHKTLPSQRYPVAQHNNGYSKFKIVFNKTVNLNSQNE